jgi:protein gp37
MAETSDISWTDGTWNPWMGCDKVGGAESECANCYIGRVLKKQVRQPWGQIYRSTSTWNLPHQMQEKAVRDGRRYKLFTCSLSDWFHRGADAWRPEAWKIVRECPDVDFLVLTKRAHRIAANLPSDWGSGYPNVWLGVSVGRMNSAHRVDKLRRIPARIRFISAEPLLESLAGLDITNIDWLIAGGESGSGFRHMDPAWADELRKKCQTAGTAFFFKQASGFRSGMQEDLLGQIHHNWPITIVPVAQPELSSGSLAPPSNLSDEDLAVVVRDGCRQFKRLIPYVAELRNRFEDRPRGKANIMGCNTWTEFCEKVLDRTDRAVRKALAVAADEHDKATYKEFVRRNATTNVRRRRQARKETESRNKPARVKEKWEEEDWQAPPAQPCRGGLLWNLISEEVLQAAKEIIKEGRRALAVKHHPDKGRDGEYMTVVNQAERWLQDLIRKEIGQ